MRRTLGFFYVFLTAIAIGLLFGFLDTVGRETQDTLRFNKAPADQPTHERYWQEINFAKEYVFGAQDPFQSPYVVRVDATGNVYVLDHGDGSIRKFSETGRSLRRFGGDTSYRPMGFLNVSDIAVDALGSVWVLDKEARALTVFAASGEIQRELKFEERPSRLILGDSVFVLALMSPVAHLFEVYTLDGTLVKRFGEVVEDQGKMFRGLEGWVSGLSAGTFAYAPLYAGVLAKFTEQGELLYLVETIGTASTTVLDVDRRGIHRVARETLNSAFGVGVWGEKIYTVTNEEGSMRARDVLDLYRSSDGQYEYSIRLPEPAIFAYLHGHRLFTVGQSTVTQWAVVIED